MTNLIELTARLDLNETDLQSFNTWLESKKISIDQFPFIKLVKNNTDLSLWIHGLHTCSLLSFTFSETLQHMELLTDVLLMGHKEELFSQKLSKDAWKAHVYKLRYPQTSQNDDELKQKLEKLPWPVGAKTKFERRGDRAGVEVKLFISSATDLTKIISSLERVKENL